MSAPNNPDHVDTRVVPADARGIAEAAALILAGACVAVPTETVYGLAADATSAEAVARIYRAKGRPDFNPLIVHVSSLRDAEDLAVFDARSRELAELHWPGPLTLVLPARAGSPIAASVTAGLPTIALRVPAHAAMRALLAATGRPLAAPSANASGRISPTTAAHVSLSLGGRVRLILDGGPTSAGLESSIVAVVDGHARLLRPGPITVEALGVEPSIVSDRIQAPGQLQSHYKPEKPLELNVVAAPEGTWLIGFGSIAGHASLSATGSLEEAAACLYSRLHEADASGMSKIAVAPVPTYGIGSAVNDRLRRAAWRAS